MINNTGHTRIPVMGHLFGLLLLLLVHNQASADPLEERLVESTRNVATVSLMKRTDAIDALAEIKHTRTPLILDALLQGNLHVDDLDPPNVYILREDERLEHAVTGTLTTDLELETKRIPVTNRMRGQLRDLLARMNLDDDNAQIRFEAVQRMIKEGIDENNIELLLQRSDVETTLLVNNAINSALSLYDLKSDDKRTRLSAIKALRGSLEGETRNELRRLREFDSDPDVQAAAAEALESIQSKLRFYELVESLFFGLSLGSVLLLAAIGLAITFGVMGVINMAHGELMMIGAYTTWVIQQLFPGQIAWSLAMAVPAAFLVAGLVGIAIERGVIRFLYGRPLETLLATFGISLILQQAARTIFSPLNRSVTLPEWMSGSMVINPALSLTYNRLYILAFGLIVFFVLMAILKRTSLGLKVRAVSQNRPMARAVGVRASWVDAMTFGLGSGVAGVAGVALSQLTNVGPNLGQAYIIDSFMVVVFGGVGNLWGTLVGAMGLGVLNKFMEPWAGAVLAKVLVLVMLILFIQKRPKGLFPQKGRAAE
ncbi:urea ABC transporter permease subunit UrtB [Marinimicrobium sp. C6131]|uniref:urea ABC transporter permease subunit UrtB n=1 Tax=Marinimicrobium sp. C6131 TaxID=3022676 RepID=UPI00223D7E1F|nr:urea ABC transporter permease subunit UrtB [Marinimicrobium sp. C6131]UZJ44420.1 urea ABC transporter permease subunit UrtB [Marinimicrobium sp. C6131]